MQQRYGYCFQDIQGRCRTATLLAGTVLSPGSRLGLQSGDAVLSEETSMGMVVLIVVLVLLFGGGGGIWYSRRR